MGASIQNTRQNNEADMQHPRFTPLFITAVFLLFPIPLPIITVVF